jgi:uncharacterized protein YfaS (alpha-2-macroglobulin family)
MLKRLFCLLVLVLTALSLAQKRPTELNVWVGRDIAPGPKIRMSLNTRNIPAVHVTAFPIDAVQWLRYPERQDKQPHATDRPVRQWDIAVATKEQKPNPQQADAYYSRQVNLPSLAPGVYLLVFGGGGQTQWKVVNVTNLTVVAKQSPKHLLVWVTDALNGAIIPGAVIAVYDMKGKLIRNAVSGADGSAFMPMNPGEETVVISKGRDYAGLPSTGADPDGRLVAHFETDRPIYRPGQTVFFKTILRRTLGHSYRVLADQKIKIEVRDPKNNPVDAYDLQTNKMGSSDAKFEIPQEGALGNYSLVLTVGKDTAYHLFTVSEYRKPEYKVTVDTEQKRYLAGEPIHFVLSAQYYFGAPVQNAEVKYSVRRNPMGWGYDEGEGYHSDGNLYGRDQYNSTPFVAEDVVHTDNKGNVTIEIKSDPKAPDSTYSITCSVTDATRRQAEGGVSVPVFSANIRLNLSSTLLFVPLGHNFPVLIHAVDLDGKPVAANVTLVESHQVWNEKKNEWQRVVLTKTKISVPAAGKAIAQMPALAEGDVQIEATAPDGTGRTAYSLMDEYIVGPFEKEGHEQQQPTLGIRLNRPSYAPGDKVTSFISSNVPGTPMLLMVEGEDIWWYKVVPRSTRGTTWEFGTNRDMAPNAFVTAVAWNKNSLISAGEIVPLPDKTRTLSVKLTPDKQEYRPGDRATYTVHTTQNGKPVPAELALTVVDEAIYALSPDNTPDLYSLYWGRRENMVSMHESAPEELSGGAYQNVSTTAPLRQRFEDTAYWNPYVETDAEGNGSVSFEVPGNLTSWRGTVRGVTEDTAVGMDTAEVVATRPVTLRLATPRQMVQGDRLTLLGTVNNRTNQAHNFVVRMRPEGLKLNSPSEVPLTVAANGEGQVQWQIEADHLGSQPPALTAEVVPTDVTENKADFSDALRMIIPVHPDGMATRVLSGGPITQSATVNQELPSDKIEPATTTQIRIWSGVKPIVDQASADVLNSYRYSTLIGAQQLQIAAIQGLDNSAKPVREALALLSKNEVGDGWGYWEGAHSDPLVTAAVLNAFVAAKQAHIVVPDNLYNTAASAVQNHYSQTNLWEYRAQLASSLTLADKDKGKPLLDEVAKNGIHLSPYGRLKVAEGYLAIGDKVDAKPLIDDVLKDASAGPTTTYLPVGEGIGWQATSIETTSEALLVLEKSQTDNDTESKMAQWLVSPEQQDWLCTNDQTALVIGLSAYMHSHPSATSVGSATVSVNGQTFETTHAKVGDILLATIPAGVLKAGANDIHVSRNGDGEAFFSVESTVYEPLRDVKEDGLSVMRRFEVQNSAGVWELLRRPLKAGESVRCTVLVWGTEIPDLARVQEPLPAGFEFLDEDADPSTIQEVRDAAVVHYLVTGAAPIYFRYYIRAESEGDLAALPATAEILRLPRQRGQTAEIRLRVVKEKG